MNLYFKLIALLFAVAAIPVFSQSTQKLMLSGEGLFHTETWQFKVSDGQNKGKWGKIGVPSQWELQGYGDYTYGRWYFDKKGSQPSMEVGEYKYSFKVPANWNNQIVEIVFDGVMTDTEVRINGKSAGEKHQGGFYQFRYDISSLLNYGKKNTLEVTVHKHSDNKSINAAERMADWWLFGGIYRPVWLEARPQISINHVAVDARCNGDFNAQIELNNPKDGLSVKTELYTQTGELLATVAPKAIANEKEQMMSVKGSEFGVAVKPWNCEDPNLYKVKLTLMDGGKALHTWESKIGFRTIEFRKQDGLYLNGTKLVLKGINRHSFHPEGGRTTNKELSIEDVKLIKFMNINAVRGHYSPDIHFLDVCDSLGLFILDELAGWQNAYDNTVGLKLQREMLRRDVNHPSVILWSNGNEGGFNYSLDEHFKDYDPQNRHVVHAWADWNDLDTHHYPAFLTGVGRFTNGYKTFMPTEFMHGMYDQGHGAGLEDFWNNYTSHPLFVGGFMWAFVDETVVRTDRNGELDSDGSNAPDGIVGPYREKEGSVFSVREIWSPLQFKKTFITPSFKGEFIIRNDYLFTNLDACSVKYNVSKVEADGKKTVLSENQMRLPSVEPGLTAKLNIAMGDNFFEGDVLEMECFDASGNSIGSWAWPIHYAKEYYQARVAQAKGGKASFEQADSIVTLKANGVEAKFNANSGMLVEVFKNGKSTGLANGPIAIGMKYKFQSAKARMDGDDALFVAKYMGAADSIVWRMKQDGKLSMTSILLNRANGGKGFDDAFMDPNILNLGLGFNYPEKGVTGMTWLGRGPYRVWKNRLPGAQFGLHHKAYNNTITGETKRGKLEYPEFKGYHAGVYWAQLEGENPLKVNCLTDGLYMQVFTPEEPAGRAKGKATMPAFPDADISFLLDIPGIQSFKPISQHGPKSQPGNVRIKQGDEGLHIDIEFEF